MWTHIFLARAGVWDVSPCEWRVSYHVWSLKKIACSYWLHGYAADCLVVRATTSNRITTHSRQCRAAGVRKI